MTSSSPPRSQPTFPIIFPILLVPQDQYLTVNPHSYTPRLSHQQFLLVPPLRQTQNLTITTSWVNTERWHSFWRLQGKIHSLSFTASGGHLHYLAHGPPDARVQPRDSVITPTTTSSLFPSCFPLLRTPDYTGLAWAMRNNLPITGVYIAFIKPFNHAG